MTYLLRMKTWLGVGLIGTMAVWWLGTAPALAHHSFAMYDLTEVRTLTGKLMRFVPGANHAQIMFELVGPDGAVIVGEDGKPVVWGVETGPASRIAQDGITIKNFPAGTIVTVSLNPLKDGRNFGSLARETPIIKCGMSLPEGGCTEETGEVFAGGR